MAEEDGAESSSVSVSVSGSLARYDSMRMKMTGMGSGTMEWNGMDDGMDLC